MSYVTTNTICKKEVTLDVLPEVSASIIQAGAKIGDEYGITFHDEKWLSGKWIIVKIERRAIYLECRVPVGIVEWCPGVTTVNYNEMPKYRYAQKTNVCIEEICLN